MPKTQGQTDQVLQLKLPSSIVRTGWGRDAVAQGGKIPLEVWTHWVADGSEIDVTIKDLEGQVVETLKGHVVSDLFRALYPVTKPNKTGGMYFEAELKAHAIQAVGPKVKVGPAVKISDVRLLDAQGKALKDVEAAQTYTVEAKVQGAPNGAVCRFEIVVENRHHARTRLACLEALVNNGKASAQWQGTYPGDESTFASKGTLAKNAEDYAVPNFRVRAECLGAAAESAPIPYDSWVEFDFGQRGQATLILPDGTKKTADVPDSGILRVDKPKAGRVRLTGFTPTGTDGKPLAPQVLPGDGGDDDDDADSDNGGEGQANPKNEDPVWTNWNQGFGRNISDQNKYNNEIKSAAEANGIDPIILKSLIAQESGFDPKAHNNHGFAGLTQIGGDAIHEVGLHVGNTRKIGSNWFFDFAGDERFDSGKSIQAGAREFSLKKNAIDQNVFSNYDQELNEDEKSKFYLAAYNAGQGTIQQAYKFSNKKAALWDDLIKTPNETSPLFKAIPESWGKKDKFREIAEYVAHILARKNQ